MKKELIIGLLAMVLLISGCTSAPTTTPQPTQTQPVMTNTIPPTETPAPTTTAQPPLPPGVAVEIKGFAYNPLTVTISKGTTVTWTNSDSAPHTVTSVSGAFDSGSISQGGTFSHTFDQAGTFEYSCTIHPTIVHGTVIVT
jgi:plastocyanin